ncbi:sigma-54-dependent Fis family transcriptional regulator [Rhodococcus rhodochrous]|uniref:Fis family transcriptional regulator n=1 Tax=Rhodococcus rhodochrous TaxID=1829 RepID=A0AA46X171_RHORH|nr:helix-turn-helix domain-containing protein [Rhodococcus rhodochrous]UZF48229.1 Fis family transcriptional regulator [Rhodococcus rhodochrous]
MTIDDATRTVLQARESVFASPSALADVTGVRPQILKSWRRSLSYGLDPDRCVPKPSPSPESSALLRRFAGLVIEAKGSAMAQSNCSVAITDPDGRLLNRWVTDGGFAATLDRKLIVPDFSVAEGVTGTGSSSIVLETGQPAAVAGPEHFNGDWIGFTCAGAPIRHPITRRLIGSLNLTVRHSDTSPVLLSWVTDMAADIERAMLDNASTEEKLLLAAYMKAKRDARHPVVCLNDRTVISNAPAARMLGPADQGLVWEVASKFLRDRSGIAALTLADGSSVRVDVTAVSDGATPIGAVVRLTPDDRIEGAISVPSSSPASLPGLVGASSAWRRLCARAGSDTAAPTLVVGEAGTGKMAVASAIGGQAPAVVDAEASYSTQAQWLDNVRGACQSGAAHVVLRHLDCLDASWAGSTAQLLEMARDRGLRVSATFTRRTADDSTTPLIDWFDEILEVPPLSDRMDDMGLLLESLTARHAATGHRVRWLPDAVQLMTRIMWPRNVASLESAVREVLSGHTKSAIGATDLPADLRARASRRNLVGLEQVEAKAIIEALRNAHGNKRHAANALGIARSTLYRKMRVLGIDLSASNY